MSICRPVAGIFDLGSPAIAFLPSPSAGTKQTSSKGFLAMHRASLGTILSIGVLTLSVTAQAQNPFKKKGEEADRDVPSTEVVAKVNGEPITRDQLASELIEMYGREHLQSMIGRVLVRQQCQAAKVDVTEEDVRKELSQILERNKLKLSEFKAQVLASQNMTLGQYLRDQVWPRLALIRLVKTTSPSPMKICRRRSKPTSAKRSISA